MVWGDISHEFVSQIATILEKKDYKLYFDVFAAAPLPFAEILVGKTFILQQDNAATERSDYTGSCLDCNYVYKLSMSAKKPDLNRLKNFSGFFAGAAYKNNRHFHTSEDLEEYINDAWSRIDRNILKTLFQSMSRRSIEFIEKRELYPLLKGFK